MNDHGRNPLWTCTRCGGTRHPAGRLGGQVRLTCTSCATTVTFDSMDEAVQAEEQLARQHLEAQTLAITYH